MALYTRFINDSAVASRAAEFTGLYSDDTTDGPWYATANNGASNAMGIGIGTQTGLQAAPSAGWTLEDQAEVARTAAADNQKSQVIGGAGYVARTGNVSTTWENWQPLYTPAGAASSGGVAGAASQAVSLIDCVTNVSNTTENNIPVPDNAAPAIAGTAQLASLAAGWVAV